MWHFACRSKHWVREKKSLTASQLPGRGRQPGRLHAPWRVCSIFSMRWASGNPLPVYEVDWDLGRVGALGLLPGEGEVGEKGAVEGRCSSSILCALAARAFEKRWEAVGEALAGGGSRQRPPPPAALSLGCAGEQGIISSLQGLCLSRWPSSPLPNRENPPGLGS